MITESMMRFLDDYDNRVRQRKPKKIKDYVYMRRIQKRIDEELKMALRLSKNHPEIFLDKEVSVNEYGHVYKRKRSNDRLKKLLLIVKCLTKNADAELVKHE